MKFSVNPFALFVDLHRPRPFRHSAASAVKQLAADWCTRSARLSSVEMIPAILNLDGLLSWFNLSK